MMRLRLAVMGLASMLAVGVVLAGLLAASPAEAAQQFSKLTFSTGMSSDYQPLGGSGIGFSKDNDGVYVTFTYDGLAPGTKLSRIVRFNGDDYNWDSDKFGYLDCCSKGGSGRYGFRVLGLNGKRGELAGGSYDVRLYSNGVEVAQGGFGISGGRGKNSQIPGGDPTFKGAND